MPATKTSRGVLFRDWQILAMASMSQFRMPVKPQPGPCVSMGYHRPDGDFTWCLDTGHGVSERIVAPYQPGEMLFVKETWRPVGPWEYSNGQRLNVHYHADDSYQRKTGWPEDFRIREGETKGKWRPPQHMTEWASRFRIKITSVGMGRRQEISEEDAAACGVISPDTILNDFDYTICPKCGAHGLYYIEGAGDFDCHECDTAAKRFRHRWDAQHAKRGNGWAENGWDWSLGFQVTD